MALKLITVLVVLFSIGYCQDPGQKVPQCELSKGVIVQFHGWKYSDIENECAASSSAYYCAFQVHSPFEHQYANITFPPNATHPWWERYHQVGWSTVQTDGGTQAEFLNMVKTCNDNNIRIYIDIEVNNAGDNSGPGYGSAGGYYDGRAYQMVHFSGQGYYHLPNGNAPEGCPTSSGVIEDYNDRSQIRHCNRLSAPLTSVTTPVLQVLDLRTDLDSVRTGYVTAMNTLLNGLNDAERGIAGYRFAHARWVDPADLKHLANTIENIKIPGINDVRPFIYSDVYPDSVIDHTEYYEFGNVEETRAGPLLSDIIRKQHGTYRLANLTLWGPNMGLMNSQDAIVFIDDPASQRGWPELTDLEKVLTFRDVRSYTTANAFMLAHPYGYPRVHSSYDWNRVIIDDNGMDKDVNDYRGPPRDSEGNIADVETSGSSCLSDWNCEHRWTAIRGLTRFRNLLNQAGADNVNNYWTNGYEQIAFSRGSNGFFVINNEATQDLVANIYTTMPAGTYCDLATGTNPIADPCEGRTVTVASNGRVAINLPANDAVPFMAIVSQ